MATQPAPGPDVPSGPACDSGRTASTDEFGTLTAYPNIYTLTYPETYTLLSVNYTLTEDGDERGPLFELFAEVRNDGLEIDCNILPDVLLAGIEIIAQMKMPPYREVIDIVETSTLARCFGPGDIGILTGVAREVRQADLDGEADLFVDLSPNNVGFEYEVPLDIPTVMPEIRRTAEGWALGGSVTPVQDIFNYGLTIYPRDTNGLIFDAIAAYPNHLEAIYAGSVTPFETESTSCQFTDYSMNQSWILGLP